MSRQVWFSALLVTLLSTAAWAEEPARPALAAAVQRAAAQTQPAQAAPAGSVDAARSTQASDDSWKVEIAPIYLWAPININSVTLPTFPGLPEPPPGSSDGGRPSGDTGASLNAAYMGAFRVEKSRWELSANFVYAGLSGGRERPFVKVSGDVVYGELLTGVRVVNHLYIEGGFRRIALNVTGQVLDYPEVKRKPGVWDPVFGATYRAPLGKHFLLTLHGDGGGFGVGSEVDVNTHVVLDWYMVRHFGLTLGYQYVYLRFLDDEVDVAGITKTLKLGTSLNGPLIGFKLLF